MHQHGTAVVMDFAARYLDSEITDEVDEALITFWVDEFYKLVIFECAGEHNIPEQIPNIYHCGETPQHELTYDALVAEALRYVSEAHE